VWREILPTTGTFLNLLENDISIDRYSGTSAFMVRVDAEGPLLRSFQYARCRQTFHFSGSYSCCVELETVWMTSHTKHINCHGNYLVFS